MSPRESSTATQPVVPPADAPPQTPLGWAQLLIEHLQFDNTAYRHKPTVVTWAGVNGATDYASFADCSGFLNALLRQAHGLTADDFDAWLQTRRPLARHYFDAIRARNKFSPLPRIAELQADDIIAIRYPNGVPGDNTGHVLLVVEPPKPHAASRPKISDTTQWLVHVADSSRSGHGTRDTRHLPNGKFRAGAGAGFLRLYADADDNVIGFAWSSAAGSAFYDATTRPLVVGRLRAEF